MARQILVIDDSSTMRQCIEWTFAFEDFVVASATSFQEAISDIDVVQPDVILLDHELGETSLDEAVDGIATKLGRQPTVILMHQHDIPLTQSELERVHAAAQVPKPFETQRLIDTVKWSLGMPITPSVAASRVSMDAFYRPRHRKFSNSGATKYPRSLIAKRWDSQNLVVQ